MSRYLESLKSTRNIAAVSITAAVYVILTMALAPFGYGPVQCRISEVMLLLAYINPIYGAGLVLGCFIANFASPYGMLDVIVGTFATFLSVLCIVRTKKLFIATLWPTIFCVFIGILINYLTGAPFIITTLTIMAGEFIVVTIIGYPLLQYILKHHKLNELLRL